MGLFKHQCFLFLFFCYFEEQGSLPFLSLSWFCLQFTASFHGGGFLWWSLHLLWAMTIPFVFFCFDTFCSVLVLSMKPSIICRRCVISSNATDTFYLFFLFVVQQIPLLVTQQNLRYDLCFIIFIMCSSPLILAWKIGSSRCPLYSTDNNS